MSEHEYFIKIFWRFYKFDDKRYLKECEENDYVIIFEQIPFNFLGIYFI